MKRLKELFFVSLKPAAIEMLKTINLTLTVMIVATGLSFGLLQGVALFSLLGG